MTDTSNLLELSQLRNSRFRSLLTLRSRQTLISAGRRSETQAATEKRERYQLTLGLDIEMMEDGVDRVNEAMENAGAPNRPRAALRATLHSCICSLHWAEDDILHEGLFSDELRSILYETIASYRKVISLDRARLADL